MAGDARNALTCLWHNLRHAADVLPIAFVSDPAGAALAVWPQARFILKQRANNSPILRALKMSSAAKPDQSIRSVSR